MTREELLAYVGSQYATQPDYPWAAHPTYAILRHTTGTWYAAIMTITCDKLGIKDEGTIDVVNVKADPEDVPLLQMQAGIFPAYHMNKAHWVTVVLDGSVPDGELEMLLDQSYQLTKGR